MERTCIWSPERCSQLSSLWQCKTWRRHAFVMAAGRIPNTKSQIILDFGHFYPPVALSAYSQVSNLPDTIIWPQQKLHAVQGAGEEDVLEVVSRQKTMSPWASQLPEAGWGWTGHAAGSWVSQCLLASAAPAGFLLPGAGGYLSTRHQSLSAKYVPSPWHGTCVQRFTNHRFATVYISWLFPVTTRAGNNF